MLRKDGLMKGVWKAQKHFSFCRCRREGAGEHGGRAPPEVD